VGYKDSSDNIQNYWTLGKTIGNATTNKGLDGNTDLGITFNNYRSEAGNTIKTYWNNYLQLWESLDGNKNIKQSVRSSQIYDYKINGNNS
jgi:hypothetical protein